MTSRDTILTRLRQSRPSTDVTPPLPIPDHTLFADYPRTAAEHITVFADKFTAVGGELFWAQSTENVVDIVRALVSGIAVSELAFEPDPAIIAVLAAVYSYDDAKLPPEVADLSMCNVEYASCRVGISTAYRLIARSGSIVMAAPARHGRRLYSVPPVHLVLARAEQIIPSLDALFAEVSNARPLPSILTVITGSSRTSDIEKKLVLGAHGPKRIVLVCRVGEDG